LEDERLFGSISLGNSNPPAFKLGFPASGCSRGDLDADHHHPIDQHGAIGEVKSNWRGENTFQITSIEIHVEVLKYGTIWGGHHRPSAFF
jgi:hypothetical protein